MAAALWIAHNRLVHLTCSLGIWLFNQAQRQVVMQDYALVMPFTALALSGLPLNRMKAACTNQVPCMMTRMGRRADNSTLDLCWSSAKITTAVRKMVMTRSVWISTSSKSPLRWNANKRPSIKYAKAKAPCMTTEQQCYVLCVIHAKLLHVFAIDASL